MKKHVFSQLLVALIILVMVSSTVFAAEEFNWIEGGKAVEVGSNFATLNLSSNHVFLNKEDTVKFQQRLGNFPTKKEIGSIYPKDFDQGWFVVLEYDEVGHISDEDKNDIDADAILKSYTKGTEEQNKKRKPDEQIHVVGWDVKPFYDTATNTLQWSMKIEDNQKTPMINYNVQKLTRKGYVSFMLVSDPSRLAQDKKTLNEEIMPKFTLKQGNRYEDFDASKDQLAEYGLSGLILGGLGLAVAKKAGLLALLLVFLKKGWILIVVAVGAVFRFIMGKSKKKRKLEEEKNDAANQNPDQKTDGLPDEKTGTPL